MKVALVTFGNEESYGLLFVAGELIEHHQEIRFFDAEEEGVESRIVEWSPDFLFFSPLTTFHAAATDLSGRLKGALPGAVAVFGGHHAASSPHIVASDSVDVAVVGPVRGSIERILAGERGLIRTVPSTPGDLPRPARSQYYRDVPRMGGRYRKLMLSMLGCPWNCSYCGSASGRIREIFGPQALARYYLGRRPLGAVLDEAREIVRYPTEEIEWVDDDVLAGTDIESWIPELVEAWEAEVRLPMYASTTSASVLHVSDRVLESLRRIVRVMGMGVQAIRPASLELFGRSWDGERRMKEAYDRLRSFGFSVNLQAIVGLPVDDPVEDAVQTVLGMQRIGAGSVSSFYPLIVYPGTPMESHCLRHGLPLSQACTGDTNRAMPSVRFPPDVTRRIRNVCKLGTLFVKYGIDERWMRALIEVDLGDGASRRLSLVRYRECVVDRLGRRGDRIFEEILATMSLRY